MINFERRRSGAQRRAVVGGVEYWLSEMAALDMTDAIEVTLTSVDNRTNNRERLGRWEQTSKVDDESRARRLISPRHQTSTGHGAVL